VQNEKHIWTIKQAERWLMDNGESVWGFKKTQGASLNNFNNSNSANLTRRLNVTFFVQVIFTAPLKWCDGANFKNDRFRTIYILKSSVYNSPSKAITANDNLILVNITMVNHEYAKQPIKRTANSLIQLLDC
jgi:hypothetical protein